MVTSRRTAASRAFSLTEMIVVMGVIVLLIGLLFPVLRGARSAGLMTDSMNRLRQIGLWMREYATDNRDLVLPSTFDYSQHSNPGRVRSGVPSSGQSAGLRHKGTWADILWTEFNLGSFPGAQTVLGQDYSTDSPDCQLYKLIGAGYDNNPLRSAASNTKRRGGGSVTDDCGFATPFGQGAREQGRPGYFAANQFFDSRRNSNANWYSMGQIRVPDRSMYLVDSWAGETIDDTAFPFEEAAAADPVNDLQVDFRYTDACLMLFLDGHVDPEVKWESFDELQTKRRVKVQNLDRN
jgi:type II secretory pathway pseudopilin PulG